MPRVACTVGIGTSVGSLTGSPRAGSGFDEGAAARQAASMRSSRAVAEACTRTATPATRALISASVPTWLSNGPAPWAWTTNVASASSASGDSVLSVRAMTQAPRALAAAGGVEHPALVAAEVDHDERVAARRRRPGPRPAWTSPPPTRWTPARSIARSSASWTPRPRAVAPASTNTLALRSLRRATASHERFAVDRARACPARCRARRS